MFFRTLFQYFRSRRASFIGIHGVSRSRFRVLPSDLDSLGHVNNGVYFSYMDLGRMDLLIRSGAMASLGKLGYYPVVSNETMSFRKSLQPWQRFTIESRVVGYDPKAVLMEQRFVVNGEIFATGFVRGRFLKKSGGTVSVEELASALEVDVAEIATPEWLLRWSEDVALPSTRADAPSDWTD